MKPTMQQVRIECDCALQHLEKLFKPHCKLTLLMRNPESDDGDMLLTRDDFDSIIAAIERLREKEVVQ